MRTVGSDGPLAPEVLDAVRERLARSGATLTPEVVANALRDLGVTGRAEFTSEKASRPPQSAGVWSSGIASNVTSSSPAAVSSGRASGGVSGRVRAVVDT